MDFYKFRRQTYKNLKATYPPGVAKEDWKIFNLIFKKLKNQDLFKNFTELRKIL